MHVDISEKLYFYILNIFIYNVNDMNMHIDMYIFSKYILYVCLFIYIINIHRTHIIYKNFDFGCD